jgi:hypothetical protein
LVLQLKFFVYAAELALNLLDLMLGGLPLLAIQFCGRGSGQTSLCAVHDRQHHLQIADQFGAGSGRSFLVSLPLRFEEQLRRIQNPLTHSRRTLAPGHIQLAGFTHRAVMLSEDRRHALAIIQTLPRYRHQKLQGHLRRDLALAHLLLDGFRQHLHQRQPPRDPAHTAIESTG